MFPKKSRAWCVTLAVVLAVAGRSLGGVRIKDITDLEGRGGISCTGSDLSSDWREPGARACSHNKWRWTCFKNSPSAPRRSRRSTPTTC